MTRLLQCIVIGVPFAVVLTCAVAGAAVGLVRFTVGRLLGLQIGGAV